MIEVTHEFTIEDRKCPMDDSVVDRYEATVRTRGVLQVEDIVLARGGLPNRAMFQEELTELLAADLPGCEVTTRGVHSGIVTTCRSGVLR